MYAAVRRYEGITDDAEAGRLVRESFMPLLEEVSGFIAYYWIDAGEGTMASLSVFEDKAGADESVTWRINGLWITLPRSSQTHRELPRDWWSRATRSSKDRRGSARLPPLKYPSSSPSSSATVAPNSRTCSRRQPRLLGVVS